MCYRDTISELDAISRQRALTSEESDRLAHAIVLEARYTGRRALNRWRPDEDSAAISLRLSGLSYSTISRHVQRTPDAVAARLKYLGHRGVSDL